MSLRWWEPTGERRSTFDCFVTTQHGHRVVTPRMRGQTDYPGKITHCGHPLRGHRRCEQVSLSELIPQGAQQAELLFGFDSFGHRDHPPGA